VTESLDQELRAPLPARISRVLVAEGEAVKKGDALVILEVMKTEFTLAAPRDAEVAVLHCKEGEWIARAPDWPR